jgi:hypothetical protein
VWKTNAFGWVIKSFNHAWRDYPIWHTISTHINPARQGCNEPSGRYGHSRVSSPIIVGGQLPPFRISGEVID